MASLYLKEIRSQSNHCNFQSIKPKKCKMNIFINWRQKALARQRFLENKTLHLKTTYEQAFMLEIVLPLNLSSIWYYESCSIFILFLLLFFHLMFMICQVPLLWIFFRILLPVSMLQVFLQIVTKQSATLVVCKCYNGLSLHCQPSCPAQGARFHKCAKWGYFPKCVTLLLVTCAIIQSLLLLATFLNCLSKTIRIKVNGIPINAQLNNFISFWIVKSNQWQISVRLRWLSILNIFF